ncbi:MAG TPA: hypothetical protein PLI62_17795 [Spirochaetota bacterium]|mgnify:CR=1 FL=1|nr:hypothetical protein [Spirochaetota bacterium]
MKNPWKKSKEPRKEEDDSLFGLLSSYKIFNTYFRILESENDEKVVVQISDNPKNWDRIPEDKYVNYRLLKRLEIGVPKSSVKYLNPEHLIKHMGSLLGTRLPIKKVSITNNIDNDGYFILETSLKLKPVILQTIKRIITLSPQKKYEILEKCLTETTTG